jgi:TonB family protein
MRLIINCAARALLIMALFFAAPCWAQSSPIDEWHREIWGRVRGHTHFPRGALGHAGEARIAINLDRSGKATSIQLMKSSGSPELDAAALEAVDKSQPFPAPPPAVPDKGLELVLPIVFAKGPSASEIENFKINEENSKLGCTVSAAAADCVQARS